MKKIVLFGELMLRLKSPGKERLFQTSSIEAVFGGSEANVAVSLGILGEHSVYVTALPDNPVGFAAAGSLKKYGVDVQPVYKSGRLGIYYLEDGACQRPSKVIYDREGSCLYNSKPCDYDFDSVLDGASWFHVSGVTPAVSENACECVFEAVKKAKEKGAVVSLDLNFRKKLWNYGKDAKSVMSKLAQMADVLIANEEDIQNCLGIPLKNQATVSLGYKVLCENVMKAFPNVKTVAVTLRHSYSADRNGWSAVLLGKSGFFESAQYDIENIVERVGAGDSFAAGLIYYLLEHSEEKDFEQKALDFATAASCLKHSIPGDFNLSAKEEILSLMNGNANGRIQR